MSFLKHLNFCNHTKDSFREFFIYLISAFVPAILLCLIVQWGGRYAFILNFLNNSLAEIDNEGLLSYFYTSTMFDFKVIATLYALPFFLALFCFRKALVPLYKRFFAIWNICAFLIISVFTVINFYYFKTYDKIIDTFFFSFLDEEPLAVLNTILVDYPLVPGIIGIIFLAFLYFYVCKYFALGMNKICGLFLPKAKIILILFVITSIAIWAFCLRGSLNKFPLREENINVTTNALVNKSVPNGLMAFYWAYKWHLKEDVIPKTEVKDIINDYAKLDIKADSNTPFAPLYSKAVNVDGHPKHPDVVLGIMESFGRHVLLFDNAERNLLGSFSKQIRNSGNDFFWLNFLSEGNGTMDSLARLFLEIPDMNFSTSKNVSRDYITDVFLPFKEAGYRIVFVTGGSGSWRNITEFLLGKGVDEVYEENAIRESYKDAGNEPWGVHDEFIMRKSFDILQDNLKSDKPILLVLLTVTNHPPYKIPKDSELGKVTLTKDVLERFPYDNTETIFGTYRYAIDAFGKLVQRIKDHAALKERTVIGATGDHNLRGIGYKNYPEESVLGYMVPFYLHVPSAYLRPNFKYNPNTWGSHKDIMATLSAVAIPELSIPSIGCNMLDRGNCQFPYVYNNDVAVSPDGKYACVIDSFDDYSFKSAKLKGIYLDLSLTDKFDCQKMQAFKDLQKHLYYYQATY